MLILLVMIVINRSLSSMITFHFTSVIEQSIIGL